MNQPDSPRPNPVTVTPAAAPVPPPPLPVIPADIAYSVAYTDGTFLTSALMNQAQTYFVNWLQLQNQLLYTAGVLNGLATTHPSGNALAVSGGAGIDDLGRFVVLPDNSGALTVPGTATHPSYLCLVYPDPVPPVDGQPNVQNRAGELELAGSIEELPPHALLLAEIAIANGAVTRVTDRRMPVDTRLPANLGVTPAAPRALLASNPLSAFGTVAVPIGAMRQQGDSVRLAVSFEQPSVPPPQFKQPPRVLVTVLGANPYATAVSGITVDGFELSVTAILPPPASLTQITIEWLAYV